MIQWEEWTMVKELDNILRRENYSASIRVIPVVSGLKTSP